MKKLQLVVPALVLSFSASVMANQTMHHSPAPETKAKTENSCPCAIDNSVKAESAFTPAGKEFEATMNRMHEPMMAATNEVDPDVAFVKGMIPHHKGAVEMAKTVLKYGKDPEIRKLAEDVINAQEGEIKMMNDWLATHDKKVK
ncbi:CopM family metallochaperone [Budvicia diplopodorum]|uniref:CopM family metallochaperone n=1 Tax=Budvicia diplopodorum TaxID=1119056 RepID=UPI001FE5EB45|nr:DUF305 domain-containing protein [Budvicia diplopodorum]